MTTRTPNYWASNRANDHLLTYPAADRNKEPILALLKQYVPPPTTPPTTPPSTEPIRLLEIASGTGQHAAHFAAALPQVTIQPTEYDAECLAAISQRRANHPQGNI